MQPKEQCEICTQLYYSYHIHMFISYKFGKNRKSSNEQRCVSNTTSPAIRGQLPSSVSYVRASGVRPCRLISLQSAKDTSVPKFDKAPNDII